MSKIEMRFTIKLIALAAMLATCAWATQAQQQAQQPSPGAVIFEKSCYSCHNIGSGDKKGPDLKGVTARRTRDWLHEFIKSPAAMNRSGNVDAQALFKKFAPEVMPDQMLSPDQVDAVLALIEDLTKKNEAFVPAGAKLARPIVPTDIDEGYRLFIGQSRLASGGAACISCHNVEGVGRLGGGTLGPDLTAVNTKYKDPELISILQNPNFPTMKSVFAARPLSDEEIVKLFAYFQNAKVAYPAAQIRPGIAALDPWFLIVGFITLALAMLALHAIWRNRHRGVREELVRRNRL
ncbi:MAG TPA: c-type cytochrome [Blastocatellia bacterium]|jgi:mono/diheme cytochrome c family protein|nr:c-type cytochrome [Blastocatellia bacterium]